MEDKKIYDITIVGGGPVGLFTAFYAGLRGVSVKIIESLSELGGQPAILYPEKYVYDIPAFPAIKAKDLVKNLLEQLERFKDNTTICLKEEVQSFSKSDDIFTIQTNKQTHFSRSIILTCGNGAFAPRKLGLLNEDNYSNTNLFYNVSDLDQFSGKDVVICGGGDSAVDWALHLEKIAKSVTIVHRRDTFRAHEYSVSLLEQSSIKILTPYVPIALEGNETYCQSLTLQKVKTNENLTLPLDSLIVSFGFSNSNKFLKTWGLDYKRSSILVNHLMQTSQEGIFAIGDAADYEGKVDLIATGFGEAPLAISQAIHYIYPERDNRLVHSSSIITD